MSHLQTFLALIADWKRGDLDAVALRLAPGVVWHYSAGSRPPARGRAAAIAVLGAYRRMQTENRLRLFTHAETPDRLFYEGVEDFDTPQGHPVQVPYAGVLDFGPDGLITGWRDYHDSALFDTQLRGTSGLPEFCTDLTGRPALA